MYILIQLCLIQNGIVCLHLEIGMPVGIAPSNMVRLQSFLKTKLILYNQILSVLKTLCATA